MFVETIWEMTLVSPLDHLLGAREVVSTKTGPRRIGSQNLTAKCWEDAASWIAGAIPLCSSSALLEPVSIEECCEMVRMYCATCFGGMIDAALLKEYVAPAIQVAEPCRLFALTVCRSEIMKEIVGHSLSAQLRSSSHASACGLSAPAHLPAIDVLLRELVETRQELTKLRNMLAAGSKREFDFDVDLTTHTALIKQTPIIRMAEEERVALRTATVQYALNSNVAFKNTPNSIVEADRVLNLAKGTGEDDINKEILEKLGSCWTIGRHALILEDALDELVKGRVTEARSAGAFVGAAFVTDESPPSATRFTGLRFQITMLYFPAF